MRLIIDEFDDHLSDETDNDIDSTELSCGIQEEQLLSTASNSQLDISSNVLDNPVQPHNCRFPGTYFGKKQWSFNPVSLDKYVWLEQSIL